MKHVPTWARSPFFAEVPAEFQEMAAASVPGRTEPLAYRSDLADRLPDGLAVPRALGVFDLDNESAAIWLEPVVHELATYPLLTAHGDASTNNLLAGSHAGLVRADRLRLLGAQPLGFDLSQLLVGDVQLGRRSPDLLAETDDV